MAKTKQKRKPRTRPDGTEDKALRAPIAGYQTIDSETIETASLLSPRMVLADCALLSVFAARAEDVGDGSFTVSIPPQQVTFGTREGEDKVFLTASLALAAYRSAEAVGKEEPLVHVQAKFTLMYHCKEVANVPGNQIEAFAVANGLQDVWPFWREIVLNVTGRMRIQPIAVPNFRINDVGYSRQTEVE